MSCKRRKDAGRRPIRLGARPHACQEEAQARLDKTLAPRPTINTTRHKDVQIFQRGRVSGLHSGNIRRTDRGNEGLFNEFVGIVESMEKYGYHQKEVADYIRLVYIIASKYKEGGLNNKIKQVARECVCTVSTIQAVRECNCPNRCIPYIVCREIIYQYIV